MLLSGVRSFVGGGVAVFSAFIEALWDMALFDLSHLTRLFSADVSTTLLLLLPGVEPAPDLSFLLFFFFFCCLSALRCSDKEIKTTSSCSSSSSLSPSSAASILRFFDEFEDLVASAPAVHSLLSSPLAPSQHSQSLDLRSFFFLFFFFFFPEPSSSSSVSSVKTPPLGLSKPPSPSTASSSLSFVSLLSDFLLLGGVLYSMVSSLTSSSSSSM
mmetsp:Transcript_136/g.239  ORF Transcript_136/g.239 Transcript_136/m.239 type:complete len:214 (-) Transcript_136:1734-2375(-)